MRKFWKWLIQTSTYGYMYLALLSFLALMIIKGLVLGILFTLVVITFGTIGVYFHYKKLKKLGYFKKEKKENGKKA